MASSIKRQIVSLVAALALVASLSATNGFARDVKTITEVEVQEEQGMTRVILRGATDPIYTAFLREDPPRLIIELPDVMFEESRPLFVLTTMWLRMSRWRPSGIPRSLRAWYASAWGWPKIPSTS